MKLSALKKTSNNMNKGKRFEIFEGVFATIIPNGGDKHKFSLSYKIQKYMLENEVEDIKDIPDEVYETISKESIVDTIIVNVEGIEDENGDPIEWTPEFGKTLIEDSDMTVFFNKVLHLSSKEEVFYEQDINEYTKKK